MITVRRIIRALLLVMVVVLLGCRATGMRADSPEIGNSALLVLHMQNDVVKEGGYMDFLPLDHIQTTIPRIENIARVMREHGRPVIYSFVSVKEDHSDALWPVDKFPNIEGEGLFVQESWGAQIVEELTPKDGDSLIEDKGFNSFRNGRLDRILKRAKVNTVIITGVHTNTCVFSTTSGALDYGYQVVVVEDATATATVEAHEAALNALGASMATLYSTEYMMLKIR